MEKKESKILEWRKWKLRRIRRVCRRWRRSEVAKARRAPRGPTQIERELHELIHLPYRDWCGHCVRGAGEKTPHRRKGVESEEEKMNQGAEDGGELSLHEYA